eukprot:6181046-Pleurochrysis_carterae.AAC.4
MLLEVNVPQNKCFFGWINIKQKSSSTSSGSKKNPIQILVLHVLFFDGSQIGANDVVNSEDFCSDPDAEDQACCPGQNALLRTYFACSVLWRP